jgi:molybdenum cofactor sulfurtransferase
MVTLLENKPWFKSREVLRETVEDGALPLHNIIALSIAIDTHRLLYGPNPMETISPHTNFLGKRLYDSLTPLRHSNGVPVSQIYKGTCSSYGNDTTQGATVVFNVIGRGGKCAPWTAVIEKFADNRGVYIRSEDLCNWGGLAKHLEFETW